MRRPAASSRRPTLGLPEKPGKSMNWDYRYCWLRDSTFTLTALLNAGFHEEAQAWLRWLLRAVGGAPDKMQGACIAWMAAARSRNARSTTFQDGTAPGRCASATPPRASASSTCMARCWTAFAFATGRDFPAIPAPGRSAPGSSPMWNAFGASPTKACGSPATEPQHYVYSKVMAWVAVDRLLALGRMRPVRRSPRGARSLARRHPCGCLHARLRHPAGQLHAGLRVSQSRRQRSPSSPCRFSAGQRRTDRRHDRRDRGG